MKYILLPLLATAFIIGMTACEESDDPGVLFVNQSTYTVQVRPNGDPFWDGFALEPGERYRVNTSRDVFFLYEPDHRVSVGKNEKRTVIFIDSFAETVEVSE